MKAKNTINGKLSVSLTQKTKIKIAIYSLVSGVAIFATVFFILQIAGVISPTENTKASTATAPGVVNQQLAMDFNGRSNFIDVGSPSLGATNKFSVTAWVRWDTIPSGGNSWANIVCYNTKAGYGSGDNGLFWLQHNSDNTKFEFALQTTSGRKFIYSTTAPQKGVWYHLAGTYDGTKMYIYVNGVLENSSSQTGNIATVSNTALMIGQWANGGGYSRRFNGQIDEVSIWTKELTVTDIKKIMCKAIDPATSKLKAYWNFNDNSSLTKVYDLTSNHYTGNITGAKYVSSGAPVGNENSSYYSAPATKYSIKHPNGDSIVFSNFSSQPTGIQLYYLDAVDNTDNIGNSPADLLLTNRTFGAFIVANSPITYNVTYYYKNNPYINTPGAKAAGGYNPSDLIFTIRPSSDTVWNSVDATNDVNNLKFTYTGLSGRTEIALGASSGHLPISLLSFSAEAKDNDIILNWKTATEINNDYFTIERSTDSKVFEIIEKLYGAGNSNMILKYDYTDRNVKEAVNSDKVYYRLKQTDFDGKYTYSGIIAISLTGEESKPFELLSASPNPFVNDIYLNISSTIEGSALVKIFSSNGTTLKTNNVDIQTGINTVTINDNYELKKGIYLISIEMNEFKSKIIKVIKN
jgi:hypothetical protein